MADKLLLDVELFDRKTKLYSDKTVGILITLISTLSLTGPLQHDKIILLISDPNVWSKIEKHFIKEGEYYTKSIFQVNTEEEYCE